MKNLAWLFMLTMSLSFLSLSGCGRGSDTQVIEAPPETEQEDPAQAGMTEEEYNKAMEESMR